MAIFNLNIKMDEKLFQSFGGTTSLAYADDLHSKGNIKSRNYSVYFGNV